MRLASQIAGMLLGVAWAGMTATAQSPIDSIAKGDGGPTRTWLSVGVGGGSSRQGGFAGRAAASIAVNQVLTFTLEGTGVGSIDGSIGSISLMVGLQTPKPDAFLFISAGPANVSCGSGCGNQTGLALDAGCHMGGAHAGISLTGFVVRAPGGSNASGVVAALDLGWFDRHGSTTRVK
jgi:hypothetical protein